MLRLTLLVMDKEYSIHRLKAKARIPAQLSASVFYSVTRTKEELSIVCESGIPIKSLIENRGWSCLKVIGPLDLNMSGIIARLSSTLAAADINIFALSTYDTDYILIKTENTNKAVKILRQADYQIL